MQIFVHTQTNTKSYKEYVKLFGDIWVRKRR